MDRVYRLETFGRVGFAAHGIVYLLVGWFAIRSALGLGSPTDTKGALHSLVGGPFGWAMLGAMALGLLSYALFRLVEAVLDLNDNGDDFRGLVARFGRIVSSVIHIGLAIYAGALAIGLTMSGGGTKGWTAWLMQQPYGPWAVMAAGVVVLGVALFQAKAAWTAHFMDNLAISGDKRRTAEVVGRAGRAARAFAFALVAVFLISAGWTVDASQAGGLAQALRELQKQPYGPWLLGVVAVGFVLFGLSSFVEAAYRRITDENVIDRLRAQASQS